MSVTLSVRKSNHHGVVIVAIGANLVAPDGSPPLQTCVAASRAVGGITGLSNPVCSRWFSSAPVPPSGQPRYINGVVRLNGSVSPVALLEALQAIERSAGRVRLAPNAARTLDLDIIDMDGVVRAAPDPVLPHPRAHGRAFVLYPLRDVAPWWRHPVTGAPVQALIDALPAQDIVAV